MSLGSGLAFLLAIVRWENYAKRGRNRNVVKWKLIEEKPALVKAKAEREACEREGDLNSISGFSL